MAHVVDGNALAEELRQSIDDEFQVLRLSEVRPGLATVIVGEDGGARAYERHVRQLAEGLEYHRSEEHTSELQSPYDLVCRLLLEKKKKKRSNSGLMALEANSHDGSVRG